MSLTTGMKRGDFTLAYWVSLEQLLKEKLMAQPFEQAMKRQLMQKRLLLALLSWWP